MEDRLVVKNKSTPADQNREGDVDGEIRGDNGLDQQATVTAHQVKRRIFRIRKIALDVRIADEGIPGYANGNVMIDQPAGTPAKGDHIFIFHLGIAHRNTDIAPMTDLLACRFE